MIKSFSLADIKEGEEVEIISINAGLKATKRLADLGLTPKTRIEVLRKAISGPTEIKIRGSRLALGRGLAKKISVKKDCLCKKIN